MGRQKDMLIEADERGWWADDDKFVCSDCVEDSYLKEVISRNLVHPSCSYCGETSEADIAAPLEDVMECVASALRYYYNEPNEAGVPWDEGAFAAETVSTEDALMSLPFECNEDLFEDVCRSFRIDDWVKAADGHWASSHEHEILGDSWQSFVFAVKHETRFHFERASTSSIAGPQEYAPGQVLPAIGALVKQLGLVKRVRKGRVLYRVRTRTRGEKWSVDAEQMGAPPLDKARAGRMNPAGIPYLYLAFDQATAVAETVASPPTTVVIARFKATQTLKVIDLTRLPPVPSIFDSSKRAILEGVQFLESFVKSIARPVSKDGSEHIEYVPSQVVSEYFAQVFSPSSREASVAGLIYPSAVRPRGKNLVVFPTERGYSRSFASVEFDSAAERKLRTWADLTAMLRTR